MLRVGVASIVQETNTFAAVPASLEDFEAQGIAGGDEVLAFAGTNTEAAGALEECARRGARPVPVMRAWAMSGGRLTAAGLAGLADRLESELRRALPLDGLVLSLHGALVADGADCADLVLLERARAVVGCPVGVCLDLHANVTSGLVAAASFVIGYRTYPHVDQAETGARAASLLIDALEGRRTPATRLAKRPLLVPAEAQGDEGPLGALRRRADALCAADDKLLDLSLFPVQPWLDVPELGFGVAVTADGDDAAAQATADELAAHAWAARDDFTVDLVGPDEAIGRARLSTKRPLLLSESADSPTAGAAGDSPAMVRALLGADLRAYVTVVDANAVSACSAAGVGAAVRVPVGASLDRRFHRPVELEGTVAALGDGTYALSGPVFTGMEVTMGRFARIDAGRLSVLVTERPACTFDPEAFRVCDLDPGEADVIVVRSAHLFRAGWGALADGALILDLPGASTPRLASLDFRRAPRPLFPLDLFPT